MLLNDSRTDPVSGGCPGEGQGVSTSVRWPHSTQLHTLCGAPRWGPWGHGQLGQKPGLSDLTFSLSTLIKCLKSISEWQLPIHHLSWGEWKRISCSWRITGTRAGFTSAIKPPHSALTVSILHQKDPFHCATLHNASVHLHDGLERRTKEGSIHLVLVVPHSLEERKIEVFNNLKKIGSEYQKKKNNKKISWLNQKASEDFQDGQSYKGKVHTDHDDPLEEDTGTQPHLGFSMDSSAWDGAGTVQGAKEWGQGGPALPPRAPCLSVRGEGHSDTETSEQTRQTHQWHPLAWVQGRPPWGEDV